MTDRRRRSYWLAALGCVAVLVIGLIWLKPWRRSPPVLALDLSPPPFLPTRYLNTGPDARYVGVAVCAECHPRQQQSYQLTAHSRALGDVDLADEPPDGAFFNNASGRSYRAYRDGKTLRHQEILRTDEGKEIGRIDAPIRFRIGSGHLARTYLVEIDGFLHESPITWYASKKQWDMSPSYDVPRHASFERPVDQRCLFCHTGRAEAADGTVHRMRLHEQVIGCENCHGPGSLHRDLHRSRKVAADDDDLTIVNPGKLARPLVDAICARCHHSGAASVLVRGRSQADFRPGRPLAEYRIDYRLDGGQEQKTVVGHMEQLRQSACYQKAPELTCVTCHDPHTRTRPADAGAYYRQICLNCHQEQACKLDAAARRKQDAADRCAGCHMPRGDTHVPHVALTHHRIGRHPPPARPASNRVPELTPIDDVGHLSALDRQWNLGLAYLEASRNAANAPWADLFRTRSAQLLESVQATGWSPGEIAAALGDLFPPPDRKLGREYGRQVIAAKGMPPLLRAHALTFLASSELEERNFAQATKLLEELTALRRRADDWRLLGQAYLGQDRPEKALAALEHALTIRPFRASIHLGLARVHERLGHADSAKEHQDKAQWLNRHQQD